VSNKINAIKILMLLLNIAMYEMTLHAHIHHQEIARHSRQRFFPYTDGLARRI